MSLPGVHPNGVTRADAFRCPNDPKRNDPAQNTLWWGHYLASGVAPNYLPFPSGMVHGPPPAYCPQCPYDHGR